MPQYKVELLSIDSEDESKDIQFCTFVDADNSDDAVAKAKSIQKIERPDINPADTWCWITHETAER